MNDGPLIIRGVDEVVAALPHLLHVHPQNSLVIFPTDPGRSPLARIDMPTTDAERDEVADELAAVYRGRTAPVVLLAYTDRRDLAEAACTRIAQALEPSGEVSAAVAVSGDRWVRLDRAEHGTVSQSSKDLFAAEGLYRGSATPYDSEARHRASFDRVANPVPEELMTAATMATTTARSTPDELAVERAWIALTIDRYVATGGRLGDQDAARLISDVQHLDLRDHAWAAIDRSRSPQHGELWKDLLVRSPAGTEAPPASLAAFSYWISGDGMSARAALERVPAEQSYGLANLISTALRAGIDPRGAPIPHELPEEIRAAPRAASEGARHDRAKPPHPDAGQQRPGISR